MTVENDAAKSLSSGFHAWLCDDALPLWSEAGLDGPHYGVWEALDHEGIPLADMSKRIRVQFRQAYVFSMAHRMELGKDYIQVARHAFDFGMAYGFDAGTGRLQALVSREGDAVDKTQDLYDLAFLLLAITALRQAGEIDRSDQAVETWERALLVHVAERGWLETIDGRLPRRQNPHMHLFEATLDHYEASGDVRFLERAEDCLALFRDVFFDARSGLLFEHFNADWSAVEQSEQVVEPGHMMEWVYLIRRYERVTGNATGIDLRRIFDNACKVGVGENVGLLVNKVGCDGRRIDPCSRLWPQTEFLKASLVLSSMGERLPTDATPEFILKRLVETYLATPTRGGWYDCINEEGKVISSNMPASTFYHLLSAFICMRECEA